MSKRPGAAAPTRMLRLAPPALTVVVILCVVAPTHFAFGGQPVAESPTQNLVRNGPLQTLAPDGSIADWKLTGAIRSAAVDPEGGPNGEPCLKLEGTGGGATMQQDVTAAANTEYLFTAWVRSDARVWVRLGSTKLTYYEPTRWQRIVGLARTAQEPKLTVRFDLYGFGKSPCAYWIHQVTLRPAQRLDPPVRKRRGPTHLAQSGEAAAYVVYPATMPGYRELAERACRAITDVSGVEIPLVSDSEATEADHPVLKEPYRSSHLILLGRLGINRAMWPAYNRFLCAADGHYPGGEGFVVRTASNVLRNDRDHLILGGSTEEGAARAVDRFVAFLRERKPEQRGTLTLPWLLEAELGGACLEQLKADDERWTQAPNHPLLPKVEPSYGTVLRFQRNAMAYYWTGWPSYKRRALEHLEQVLEDDAVMSHYVAEFFVRVCAMFDNSGVRRSSPPRCSGTPWTTRTMLCSTQETPCARWTWRRSTIAQVCWCVRPGRRITTCCWAFSLTTTAMAAT